MVFRSTGIPLARRPAPPILKTCKNALELRAHPGAKTITAVGMDTKPLDDLLAHWHSLPVAAGAKVPAKSALSPEALKLHLPNIGIFEWISRYDLQVRLFGTNLDEKFGKPMTGANLFDIHAEENWDFYANLYAAVLDTPAGCRIVRKALDANGKTIHGISLGLPLADKAGDTLFLVSVLVIESESPLDDPMDSGILRKAKIIEAKYLDIGHGLPANPPALPN